MKEADLAESAGVDRSEIKAIRETLEEGTHWQKGKGGAIEFTEDGVAAVTDRLASGLAEKKEGGLPEEAVAIRLGIARGMATKLRKRHLTADTDWWRDNGNSSVIVSRGGVEKLAAAISSKKDGGRAADEADSDRRPIHITKLTRNPRIVLGTVSADDTDRPPVRVQVRDSAKLETGMVLHGCIPLQGSDGALWRYTGRLPRYRGKW